VVYRALADLLVIAHLAFIVFVILGGLLALHRWWLSLLHLPAAIWGVFIEISGHRCPLTPLENEFRRLSGSGGYPGGFVEHYLLPLVYPTGLTREVQLLLALLVLLANLMVYGFVAHHWLGRRRRAAARRGAAADRSRVGPR
jgi:hypothetical protein